MVVVKNNKYKFNYLIHFVILIGLLIFFFNFSLFFHCNNITNYPYYKKKKVSNNIEINKNDLIISQVFAFSKDAEKENFYIFFANFREQDVFYFERHTPFSYYFLKLLEINNGWEGIWSLNFRYSDLQMPKIKLQNREIKAYRITFQKPPILKKIIRDEVLKIKTVYNLRDNYEISFINLDSIFFLKTEKLIFFRINKKSFFAKKLFSELFSQQEIYEIEGKTFQNYYWKTNWFLSFEYWQEIIKEENDFKIIWYLQFLKEPVTFLKKEFIDDLQILKKVN